MIKKLHIILAFASALAFTSCKDDQETPAQEENKPLFVSATLAGEVEKENLKALAQLYGQGAIADKIQYGIQIYKFVYKTTYKGEEINASGMLYMPKNYTGEAPLLSIQHGTTFKKADAPSLVPFTGMEFFASAGYMTLMPDYLGYGESKQIFHPYYVEQYSAMAVIDMIKAFKEYATEENILISDDLFLAGYSEGGYVTMAAAKEIQENTDHDLQLSAVAAGAGGYDLEDMLATITSGQTYTYPAYLAFLLMAYNESFDWNKPTSYFFAEPYASKIAGLLDGTKDGGYINSQLTNKPEDLFNSQFFSALKGSETNEVEQALNDNTLIDWSPKMPVRLYHGTSDTTVPYSNSETSYNKLKANGASDIELIPIQGGTHGSSLIPMIEDIIPWFEEVKALSAQLN